MISVLPCKKFAKHGAMIHFAAAIFFVLLTVLIPGNVYADDLHYLASNNWEVIVPESAGQTTSFAASELTNTLKYVGFSVTVSTSESSRNSKFRIILLLSSLAGAKKNSGEFSDAFELKIDGSDIVIKSSSERGILYGAYQILDLNGLGAPIPNFVWSSELFSKHRNNLNGLSAPKHAEYTPAFNYRGGLITFSFQSINSLSHTDLLAIVDWMARNKMNTVGFHRRTYNEIRKSPKYAPLWQAIADRALDITVEGHASEEITSRQDFINQVTTFAAQHPEARNLGLWGRDNTAWGNVFRSGDLTWNKSAKQLELYRGIAESLGENNKQRLIFLAYQDFITAPNKLNRISDPGDFLVYFCPITRSYNNPLQSSTSEQDKKHLRDIADWDKRGFADSLILYAYYRKHNWNSLPVNMPNLIRDELLWWHSGGHYGGWNYLAADDWLAYDLQHYAYARFLWNPQLPAEEVTSDFFAGATGLPDNILADFIRLHGEMENIFKKISGDGYFAFNIKGLGGGIRKDGMTRTSRLESAILELESVNNRLQLIASKHKGLASICRIRMAWVEHWLLKLRATQKYASGSNQAGTLLGADSFNSYVKFLSAPPLAGLVRPDVSRMADNALMQLDKNNKLPSGMAAEKF